MLNAPSFISFLLVLGVKQGQIKEVWQVRCLAYIWHSLMSELHIWGGYCAWLGALGFAGGLLTIAHSVVACGWKRQAGVVTVEALANVWKYFKERTKVG